MDVVTDVLFRVFYVGYSVSVDNLWSEPVVIRNLYNFGLAFPSNVTKKEALSSIGNSEAEIIWLYAAYNR